MPISVFVSQLWFYQEGDLLYLPPRSSAPPVWSSKMPYAYVRKHTPKLHRNNGTSSQEIHHLLARIVDFVLLVAGAGERGSNWRFYVRESPHNHLLRIVFHETADVTASVQGGTHCAAVKMAEAN